MRQPQLGGVRSNALPVVTLHDARTHRTVWRHVAGGPLVCATCHPPASERVVAERREVGA